METYSKIIDALGLLTPIFGIFAICWYKTMKNCNISRCTSISLLCGLVRLKRLPLSDTIVQEILHDDIEA
jgi:hypothetical protein